MFAKGIHDAVGLKVGSTDSMTTERQMEAIGLLRRAVKG